MTTPPWETLPAAARHLLDYVALLGPQPVPRAWLMDLSQRDKGLPPRDATLKLAASGDCVDDLVDGGLLVESDAGFSTPPEVAEALHASIYARPAYRSTLWNALSLLALRRGKLLRRGHGTLRELPELLRCIPLVQQLAAQERPLSALDLATQIAPPLCAAGKQPEAIALLESLLKPVEEAAFTRRHILALHQLAEACLAGRDGPKAYLLRTKALELSTRLNGPRHRDTAFCHAGLAQAAAVSKKPAEALTAAWQAIALYRQHVPDDHHLMAYPLESLAIAQMTAGKVPEARESMQRAVALRRSSDHAGKDALAIDLFFVASTFLKTRQWKEAEPWMNEALALRMEQLGPDATALESLYSGAAAVARGLEKHADARKLTEKVIALRSRRLPSNDPLLTQARILLSGTLLKLNLEAEALALSEQCLTFLEAAAPPPPLAMLKMLHYRILTIHAKHQRQAEVSRWAKRLLAFADKNAQSPADRWPVYMVALTRLTQARLYGDARDILAKTRELLAALPGWSTDPDRPAILDMKEADIAAGEEVVRLLEGRRTAWEAFTAARRARGLAVSPEDAISGLAAPAAPADEPAE